MSEANAALMDFLRQQENGPLAAGDMSAMVHASPEGGTDTVGFGHKLTPAEVESGKIHGFPIDSLTAEEAEIILAMDVKAKSKTLDRSLKRKFGKRLAQLSPRKQAMLLDYEFNLGSAVDVFPTFTGAVLADDDDVQKDEMIRTFERPDGQRLPLARNRAFYNTFMSPAAKERLGE